VTTDESDFDAGGGVEGEDRGMTGGGGEGGSERMTDRGYGGNENGWREGFDMEVHVLELEDALDANKVFCMSLYVSPYMCSYICPYMCRYMEVPVYGSARAEVEGCVGRE